MQHAITDACRLLARSQWAGAQLIIFISGSWNLCEISAIICELQRPPKNLANSLSDIGEIIWAILWAKIALVRQDYNRKENLLFSNHQYGNIWQESFFCYYPSRDVQLSITIRHRPSRLSPGRLHPFRTDPSSTGRRPSSVSRLKRWNLILIESIRPNN